MSRHTLILLGLVAVIGGGASALPAAATGPACVTYEDAAGDADGEDTLDLVSLSLDNTATHLVATLGVKKLATMPTLAPGYGFQVGYTFNGKKFEHAFFKYGVDPMNTFVATSGDSNRTWVDDDVVPVPVTAVFDLPKNLVTLSVKLADLEPYAAAPWLDARFGAINAVASDDIYLDAAPYDTLTAPEGATYHVRGGCGPDAADPGTPPKAPHFLAPDVAPRADCFTAKDTKGDGTTPIVGSVAVPNDPSLDLLGIAVNVTDTQVKAYLQVDKLADRPTAFAGDRYEFTFGYEGKVYTLAGGRIPAPFETAPLATQTRGQVNGTTNAAIKPTAVYDKTANRVVLTVSRAALEGVHGAAIPLGALVTGVAGRTVALLPDAEAVSDVATNADDTKWVFGNSTCFVPPAAKLVADGAAPAVQYGDRATLRAKLTAEDGTALAGKTVRFTLGSASASGTTNASGVATASVLNTGTAGAGSFTAAFAGDTANGPATMSAPITLSAEVTRLTLAVAKNGTARTVTATLKDDDGKAVAGQTVTWTVNGKSAGSGRTDTAGRVVLKTAKATQTVVAKFAGVTGKYTAVQATKKV